MYGVQEVGRRHVIWKWDTRQVKASVGFQRNARDELQTDETQLQGVNEENGANDMFCGCGRVQLHLLDGADEFDQLTRDQEVHPHAAGKSE